MAGKMCIGEPAGNAYQPRLMKAYAEGRINSIAVFPSAGDNPHPANTPENDAWTRGFLSYGGPGGVVQPQDCVAERGTV